MTEILLKAKEVAVQLNYCVDTVYRMAKNGEIPHVKIGKQWRFRQSDVDKILQSSKE